jgi:uncharacterized protein (TIGR03663 family)
MDRPGWARGRRWPWLALVALALVLHLWGLGDRSFHHDESIHAHSSYNLLASGIYRYDPTYHGPLLYYLTAAAFAVLGDSDFTARLPVALAGVLLVAVAWSLRRPLGERAAWWTGLLATISPTCLYYGRFLRMDVLEMLTASAAAVAFFRAARGSPRAWIWAGVFTGLAFATKENAYVTSALVVAVWLVMAVAGGPVRSLRATLLFLGRHRWGLLTAVASATLVVVPLFTVGFSRPEDWFFPGKAIGYWWGQHEIARVAGPWWYHLPRLGLYEFLALGAALAWTLRRRRRMGRLEVALLLFGVLSVVLYGYLREKVPWLAVHQVWAFLPLAGAQLGRTFSGRGRWWSRTLAGAALAITAVFSLQASFVLDEISPKMTRVEALIYVQTCPEIQSVVAEGIELRDAGADPAAAVSGSGAWPLTWYWRHVPVWWSEPRPGLRPPLVIADAEGEAEVRRLLGPGYRSERVPLRAWWLMEQQTPSSKDIVRYLATRVPWGGVGASDVVLLRRSEEPVEWLRSSPPPAALAEQLPVTAAHVFGEGWLAEPRGIAVRDDGVVAVADVGGSAVLLFDRRGEPLQAALPGDLSQPEAVAWTPERMLVIADTWNHRVLLVDPESGAVRALPTPPEGWYGPRGLAVAPDGTVAVSDTGNKRLVLLSSRDGAAEVRVVGSGGTAPGFFVEPVGLAWLDRDRLLVCDTGNRRLQMVSRDGAAMRLVPLPGGWSEFYSRPQVAALGPRLWLASDTPAATLWLVRDGVPEPIDLGSDGIVPSGLAVDGSRLLVADVGGRIWVFDLSVNS